MFVKQFRNDNKKGLNEAPFRNTPKVNTWNLIIHLLILINDIFHQKANSELTVILKFDYLKELQDQYLDISSRNLKLRQFSVRNMKEISTGFEHNSPT